MPDPIFRGAIQGGKIELEMRAKFAALIASLEGKQVDLILRKRKRSRSSPQNRWYFGVIIPLLADHCGYDREEMHEALKFRFLRSREDSELPTVRSTAGLTTLEFTEYAEQCRRLAAEMGVYIPDPNEVIA